MPGGDEAGGVVPGEEVKPEDWCPAVMRPEVWCPARRWKRKRQERFRRCDLKDQGACGGNVSSYTERAQRARDCFIHCYNLTDGSALPYQLRCVLDDIIFW